jgi:hypothetical protein
MPSTSTADLPWVTGHRPPAAAAAVARHGALRLPVWLIAVLSAWLVSQAPIGNWSALAGLLVGVALWQLGLLLVAAWERPSAGERAWQLHLLTVYGGLRWLLTTRILPPPMVAGGLRLLGCAIGRGTTVHGLVLDPCLTHLGQGSLIGVGALLVAHDTAGGRTLIAPIRVGDRVTIGGAAVLLAGVTVDDDAVIADGAVVRPGTHIGGRTLGRRSSPSPAWFW